VITFLQGAAVVRKNKLSGHREEKGVSWDLQGGVHALEGDTLWRLAERET